MKRYLILLLAVIVTAVSCTTPRYVSREPSMKAEWIGRSHADIVRTFGAPTREVSDGADGVILVYETISTTYTTDQFGSTITTKSREHRDFKEFSVGPDDICYDVRTNATMQSGQEFNLPLTLVRTYGYVLGGICVISYIAHICR